MIELVEENIVKTEYAVDEETGVLTVNFRDEADSLLGSIEIEGRRFRSLLQAMSEVGKTLFPDADTENNTGHRTVFKSETQIAETEFL